MGKKLDLVGKVFGRLTVLEEAGRDKFGKVLWRCKCDCGAEVTVTCNNLRSGNTNSCGCYDRDNHTTHGMYKTKLYNVWHGLKVRTGTIKGADGKKKRLYQDRGITLCEEWKSFENFRDWALSNGYSDDLEIDRIDNDKGYTPENCRCVSRKENDNNRRNTLRLEDGTSLAMFCSEIGIQTCENGKLSKQYSRIRDAYAKSHKIHPELLARANEYLNTLRKLRAVIDLLKDVREFRERCKGLQTSDRRI